MLDDPSRVNPYDALVVEFVSVVLANLEQDELIHQQQLEALHKQESDSSKLFERTKQEEDSRTLRVMTLARKTLEARMRLQAKGEAEREKLMRNMAAIEDHMRRFTEKRREVKISTHQALLNSMRDHEMNAKRREAAHQHDDEKYAALQEKFSRQDERVRSLCILLFYVFACF